MGFATFSAEEHEHETHSKRLLPVAARAGVLPRLSLIVSGADMKRATMKLKTLQTAACALLLAAPLTLRAEDLKIFPAVELEFPTAPGGLYQILCSSNFAQWWPLGDPVSGTGQNYNLLVSTRTTGMRFYQLEALDATPGLVAWYKFDGNAQDSSTNRNHGQAFGLTLSTNRFGRANAAYRFQGNSTSFVKVPHSASLNITNAITLTAWINFEMGGTIYPRIINKDSYDLATGPNYRNPRRLHFLMKNPAQTELYTPAEVMQAGRWHFVTATYDGSLVLVYVDGALLNATVVANAMMANTRDVNIGRNTVNTADNYQGLIDDVRIYNRALSAAEITALFNQAE